jgi:chaperone required for assembly of F1-ATPase
MPRNDWFPENGDPATYDPVRSARGAMKSSLPKRFYQQAGTGEGEGGFHLLLDGRPARTPARKLLALPARAAAELLAAEWAAQAEVIDPAAMPLTRIVNAALDHVAERLDEVRADAAKYAGSDLLCYRAEEPQRLVAWQHELWDPVLDWAAERYGARFVLSAGVSFVEQPARSQAAVREAIDAVADPAALAALHVMTTLTGSVLLALAVAERRLTPEQAFALAELDADTQREIWGADAEADAARARREREMLAAAALYLALT